LRKLRWSLAAANDLEEISNYLNSRHPSFAASTIQRLYDSTRALKHFPFSGRIGKKPGTRELVFTPLPCMLVYSVSDEAIHILRFLHTSRDRD
jgi:toxin ParE1/3/4